MKVLKSNKFKVSAAVVVLVLGVSIGGTIAWLHKSTDTVRNSFDPGLVNVTIDENFEPGDVRNKTVVKQVRIKNSRQDSKGNFILKKMKPSFLPLPIFEYNSYRPG